MSRRSRLAVLLAAAVSAFAAAAPAAVAQDPTLTVSRSGGGTVTSAPAGINCGSDCSEAYAPDTVEVCEFDHETKQNICTSEFVYTDVTLTASTHSGWSFQGWTGACSGTGGCTVTMDGDYTVGASWTDVQNPSVSLTSPAGPYAAGTISVQASASDNDQVSKVDFYVGATKIGEDTTAPYSTSFNTSGSDGNRQFRAVAFDRSGRSAEASRTVMLDNTDPTLSFTSGPNGQTFGPGTTQTWIFTAGDAHSGVQSVQCKLDRAGDAPASYGPCIGGSSSYSVSDLPGGSYTLSVRVTDNVGRSVVGTRTFQIDATAPETSITAGPAEGSSSTSTTATFEFTASEPGSTFHCRVSPSGVTPGAFGACSDSGSHTASGLAPGTYVFQVRATDQYGNIDATPAQRTFTVTVDTTDPTLSFTSGPNGQTFGFGTTQTWTFNAADAHSGVQSVQCKLDRAGDAPAAYGPCSGGSSSHSVSGRPHGSYTLSVRVTDNVGRSVVGTRTFAIDSSPPETTITGGPADGSSSTSTSATFDFAATEPGSSFACRVYPAGTTPGAFGSCSGSGSHTASGLAPGTYSFEVRATDPYGNVDSTPAKRTFTVTATTEGGGGGGTGGGDTGDGGTGGGGGGTGTGGGGELALPTLDQIGTTLTDDLATAAGPLQGTLLSALRRKKKFVVTLRALTAGRFTVSLAGSARRGGAAATTVIAKGSRTVTAAGTYKITVRLTAKGVRALRGARRLSGKLTVRFVDSANRSVTRSKKVTLKRR